MTDPVRYIAFVQKVGDNWRQFRIRDDVDEERGYWAIRSDGGAEWVSAWDTRSAGSPPRSRFSQDEEISGVPRSGLFGTPLFRQQMIGNPLRGRPGNSVEVTPEAQSAVRRWLAGRGYDGVAVTAESAFDIAEEVQKTEAGLIQDEDPAAELLRTIVARMGEQEGLNQFRKLFRDPGKAERVLSKLAGEDQGPNALGISPEELAARSAADPSYSPDRTSGSGIAGSLGARVLGEGRATAIAAGKKDPGPTAGNVAGGGGRPGTAKDPKGGLTEIQLPKTPGKGPGDVEVTPELLKEYLDGSWRLVFNATVNKFRDAGAAAHFLDWFASQATRYLGEYEGTLGEAAASGQLPSGSFRDFMERKTGQTLGTDAAPGTAGAGGASPEFASWLERRTAPTGTAGTGGAAAAEAAYTPPEPLDEAMRIAFGPSRPSGI